MIHNFRICNILGTSRPGSYTGSALDLAVKKLRTPHKGLNIYIDDIRPNDLSLPFPGHKIIDSDTDYIKDIICKSDGLIFATPEYHGGMSATSKLIIENLGYPSALKNKPVSLLGCAAGKAGAYKALDQLSSVLSHVGALPIPEFISIAQVRKAFDEQGNCLDNNTSELVECVADQLLSHLIKQRES
tara:strand:+ start:27109 stop:27669 length:561 start_codon:yes stop_codon:yes gene_type:complete